MVCSIPFASAKEICFMCPAECTRCLACHSAGPADLCQHSSFVSPGGTEAVPEISMKLISIEMFFVAQTVLSGLSRLKQPKSFSANLDKEFRAMLFGKQSISESCSGHNTKVQVNAAKLKVQVLLQLQLVVPSTCKPPCRRCCLLSAWPRLAADSSQW